MAGNFLTKVIGLAALGIASYDTIETSSHLAPKYKTKYRLDQINDVYMKNNSLASCSKWDSRMQNWAKGWTLDNNFFDTTQSIKSKTVSFVKSFWDNAVLFGLGATALFTGKGKLSVLKVPYLDKIAAGILAFKAGKSIIGNVLGFGGKDYRSNTIDY